jgi:hypothetical protein
MVHGQDRGCTCGQYLMPVGTGASPAASGFRRFIVEIAECPNNQRASFVICKPVEMDFHVLADRMISQFPQGTIETQFAI